MLTALNRDSSIFVSVTAVKQNKQYYGNAVKSCVKS